LERPAGVYRITPESCFRFEQHVYQYDTSNPHVIDLDPVNYLVSGFIKKAQIQDSENDIVADVVVEVRYVFVLKNLS
jgi:hypothetical protein